MQNTVVFQRDMDKIGRIVIPIDLRRMYGIEDGDVVLFIPQEEGILIRKAEKEAP